MKKLIYGAIGILLTIITIPIIINATNNSTTKDVEIFTVVDFTSNEVGQKVELDNTFYLSWLKDDPSIIYVYDGIETFILSQSEQAYYQYSTDDYKMLIFELGSQTISSSSFSAIDNAKIYYIIQVDSVSPEVKILLNLLPLILVIGLLGSSYFVYKKY